jgi:dsDNA-specific endonuclease/ATPase MutS2
MLLGFPDPVTMARLIIDRYSGGSNALAASQLGLPAEIIAGAKERLSKGCWKWRNYFRFDGRKQKIEATQKDLQRERKDAAEQLSQLQKGKDKLKEEERNLVRKLAEARREEMSRVANPGTPVTELKRRNPEKLEQAQKPGDGAEQLKSPAWQTTPSPRKKSQPVYNRRYRILER